MGRRLRHVVVGGVVTALAVASSVAAGQATYRGLDEPAPRPTVAMVDEIERVVPTWTDPDTAPVRTVDAYRGLGAWIDAFDFSPAYTRGRPPLTPTVVDAMADAGVRTIYVQAARDDMRSPSLVEDPWAMGELVARAHARGMQVVAWYLPRWNPQDLVRLEALRDFRVMGRGFDGIAVDIEWTEDGLTPDERGARLVALSRALRERSPGEALGAIVLPPVLTDVVNTQYWPRFPWRELAPLYDVWLPMSYWSFRSRASGWKDGYRYNADSTTRLRAWLGRPDALVHGIGGIGAVTDPASVPNPEEPLAALADLEPFVRSLTDTASIGGSLYDWQTTDQASRARLEELFRAAGLAVHDG